MFNSLMMLSLLVGIASVMQQSIPDNSAPQMSAYASQREALMAFGNDAMRQRKLSRGTGAVPQRSGAISR